MTRAYWKKIQQALEDAGFDPGPVDGLPGSATKAAVKEFQKSKRLTADGIFGNKTHLALFNTPLRSGHSVMKAAELVALSYSLNRRRRGLMDDKLEDLHKRKVVKRCSTRGAEAYMLDNGCLLIPGSNTLGDYFKYNFRLWNLGKRRLKFASSDTSEGASRTVWHQGFFTHAVEIYNWIGPKKADWPKLIVGHSLGAASAQILSKSWAAPAIGFAAPRTRKSRGAIQYDRLSLSICRKDDTVCNLPSGFHRMGHTKSFPAQAGGGALNHKMTAYIEALKTYEKELGGAYYWNP